PGTDGTDLVGSLSVPSLIGSVLGAKKVPRFPRF
ncbi:hypothetical protein CCACVL1_06350, partial [Corchorus capsularis]